MRCVPRRTATNIPSSKSARLGHGASARRKYDRLAKLAFERAHLTKDTQRAGERVGNNESRLDEIEAEEAYLLASIQAAREGEPVAPEIKRRPRSARHEDGADFVLRY